MATSYDVAELVGYQSQICLISEIRPTQGGYNAYYLEDIDAERTYVAFNHQLVKASQLDVVILVGDVDMGSDDVAPAQLVHGQPGGEAVPVVAPTLVAAPTPATEKNPSQQIFMDEWTGVNLRYLLKGTTYISFYATIFSSCPALCVSERHICFLYISCSG